MTRSFRVGAVTALAIVLSAATMVLTTAQAGAAVRGYNGKTIRVGGMWTFADFSGAQVGAEAYFDAINKTNYLKGVKIKFVTYLDDQLDPATALSDVRELVTEDNVFAVVPDLSSVNPGTYLKAQQVPYVGWGIDGTYCSTKVSTSLWGFGYSGCSVPSNPPVEANSYAQLYKYVKSKTGSAHPTLALFTNDDQSGATTVRFSTVAAKGAGFKVVYNKSNLPVSASDYTPYVQQLMTAAGGKQPQMISCDVTTQCIPMWAALKNAGYTGTFFQPLGPIAALESAFQGTITFATYNTQPSPGLSAMQKAMDAVSPGTQLSTTSNVPAYFGAAMFVAAIHKVQTKKQAITPQSVQKALSTITWSIPGLVGPIKYPASTVVTSPWCSELLAFTGGTTKLIYPYTCTSKTFKVTASAEKAG